MKFILSLRSIFYLIKLQLFWFIVIAMRIIFVFLFLFLFTANKATASVADSTQFKIISLDSLSDEDLALLEEYKDSFLLEVKEIKKAMGFKNRKPIDTTVALMNRSSHFEIGLNATGPILSNGRSSGLTGAVLTPSAMYYHKLGLYATMGMSFFTDTAISHSAKVPSLFISPGFYRTFYKRWTFSLAYSRNFIFYGNDIQKGLLNNSFSLYNSFDFWKYITVSVNAGISWSSNLNSKKFIRVGLHKVLYKTITVDAGQSYAANIGISLRKDFCFYNIIGAKVFTITPDIYFLFGNDNSTLITRSIKQKNILTSDKFFGFLDVEPGITLDWRIRNVEIFGSFHCAIPFNEYDTEQSKRIKNPKEYYPYGEGGIKYLFTITPKSSKGDLKPPTP